MIMSRSFVARAYPYLAMLPLLATGLAPATLNPLIVTVFGLMLGGALCIAGVLTAPRPVQRDTAVALALLAVVAAWFALASLWAVSPQVALLGLVGQHNAAAVWALGAVWAAAGVLCADARSLRETLLGVALVGAFFSVASLVELSRYGSVRGQGYAAGLFENSNSAGELFAAAIFAAVTCALVNRDRRVQALCAAAGILSAVGLYVSDSRTGLLGLTAVVLFAGMLALVPPMRSRVWALASLPAFFALAATALGVASARGSLGEGARRLVALLGTDRDVIWRAALAQIERSPLFGEGAEQFSAVMHWSVAGGGLTSDGTAHPHNLLLAALLGGGIVGLALALAAFTALLREGVTTSHAANRALGVCLVASAPVLLLGAGLVSWVAPAAMLAITSITGASLGAASRRVNARPATPSIAQPLARNAALTLGSAALAVALFGLVSIPAQYEYVRGITPGAPELTAARAAQLYERSHDPGMAQFALESLTPALQAGDPAAATAAQAILASAEKDARWSFSLALRSLIVAQALEADDAAGFARFEQLVAAGAEADPASGAWYAFAAFEADRLGLTGKARAYAVKALARPADEQSRAELETLARP